MPYSMRMYKRLRILSSIANSGRGNQMPQSALKLLRLTIRLQYMYNL